MTTSSSKRCSFVYEVRHSWAQSSALVRRMVKSLWKGIVRIIAELRRSTFQRQDALCLLIL